MRRLNKTLAGLMAAVMVLLGVSVTPVEAADATAPTTVYYATATEFKISDYWGKGTNGENLVPVKDGYVFGGWYTAENGTPIKKEALDTDLKDNNKIDTVAVAKFVPSYILSVKMQINATTETGNGTLPYTREEDSVKYTNMRLLSAVDSVKYQNVGFDIVLDKTGAKLDLNYTKVYAELGAKDNGALSAITPSGIFGSPATHFIAAELSNIVAGNLEKIIYVTPYWTTIDGTKVEGASKFIRVMDGYDSNRFISIPVNLSVDGQAAAGMVTMSYDKEKLQFVTAKDSSGNAYGWDTGVSFAEMEVNTATAGTIKFVGNGKNVDTDYMTGKDIYANVWFQVKEGVTLTTNALEFAIGAESFCTWGEAMLDGKVTAWDVLY